MTIGIIIPVYNEEDAIYNHFQTIYNTLQRDQINPKFILIDDGSRDNTWIQLEKITEDFEAIKIIKFTRNFGKEMAICAGIDHINADRYVIMDSDLQHPPKHIAKMLTQMDITGANIIDGVKADRGKEKESYKWLANSFYKGLKLLTSLEMNNSSDFKVIDEEVAMAIRGFNERNIFFRGIVNWVGFHREVYYFTVEERGEGDSSFSIKSLIKLAFTAIFSYTSKPLFIPMIVGTIFFFIAIILGIQTLFNYFLGIAVSGFSTVILLQLIIGSILMFSLGIIGIYIARIYDEIKGRPRYLIAKEYTKGNNINESIN